MNRKKAKALRRNITGDPDLAGRKFAGKGQYREEKWVFRNGMWTFIQTQAKKEAGR